MQGEGSGGEDDFAALLPTRVRTRATESGEPSPTQAVRAGRATTATQAAPANNVEGRVVVHFGGNTSAPSGRTAAEPNAVRTTRYTALTFVFRNLYEQFSARLSYFYFLALILINQLPVLAVFGRLVSMVPLLTVVVATAAKDIFEDARRRAADRSANARKVEVIACGTGEPERWGEGAQARATSVEWKSIAAGTLVVVREGHEAPADLVLLGCGGADAHVAHVDTAALDGENALKRRVAARPASIGAAAAARAQTSGPEDCAGALRGRVECDAPNGDLDTFRGELHIEGEGQVKVTPVNTMLRGSVLRMTPWVIGVAVYVGHEAKVMMASTPPPSKRTLLERRVNVHMMLLGALLATICTIGAVGAYQSLEMVPAERMPWFGAEYQYDGKINFAVVTWFGLLILYQVLVPIALFIGMEIVRLVQAYLMATDLQLYEESRDQPCVVRTLTVNEVRASQCVARSRVTGALARRRREFCANPTDALPPCRRAWQPGSGLCWGAPRRQNWDAHREQHVVARSLHDRRRVAGEIDCRGRSLRWQRRRTASARARARWCRRKCDDFVQQRSTSCGHLRVRYRCGRRLPGRVTG